MITFHNLAIRRGPRQLFSDLDAAIHAGWKLAVVGRNGCGKSSLFAAMLGTLDTDVGGIELPAGARIGSVAQETPALEESAADYVLQGDAQVAEAVLTAERAEAAGEHEAAAQAHQQIAALNAYDARARAGKLLHGLGFAADTHGRAVAAFSGGWRVRLNLARALMTPSDLLLLDEPTNHLDLDAVLWLEQWLRHYQGVLMVISHDREFLDSVVDHTLHLGDGTGQLYAGNYTAFERQRSEQLAQQQARHQKEQAEREHLESFVKRFRAKATKARQAQSRVKRLEKLAGTEAVRADRPVHFHFPPPERTPQSMLKIVDATIGYPASGDAAHEDATFRTVLRDCTIGLEAGDRIGLLGANGAGKTTLVRALTGDLVLHEGSRSAHKDLVIGYFAQHTVESLRSGETPFDHLRQQAPDAPKQALRDWLGHWQLGGDRAFYDVDCFSGGERARLALALIAWQKPNLLLLDEPTNHLDMDMREALAEALNDYTGALLLVSHDRHLLGLVCDDFQLVANGRVRAFDGDLDDYAEWSRKQKAADSAQRRTRSKAHKQHKPAARRQELRQWRKQQQQVEKKMTRVANQLQDIEQHLADPESWQQPTAELAKMGERQNGLRGDKQRLEEQWLQLAEQIEAAEA